MGSMNITDKRERISDRFYSPMLALLLVVFVAALTAPRHTLATTVTFNSSGNWTAPAGVTSITVEAWGGGGAGGAATGKPAKGGGGAGGQYASKIVTVVPGNSYSVAVGQGGNGGGGNGPAGGDSTFAASVVVAKGGAGGAVGSTNNGTAAGGSGSAAGGIGTTVFAGGDGSDGLGSGSGGAGGGGAGSGGAGGNASGNSAGSGTASGGGTGAAARTTGGNCNNSAGSAGGGGCGGYATSGPNRSGGDGANGAVVISYFPPTVTTLAASAVTATTATLNGTVSSNGASTTVTFDFGPTAAYGSTVVAVPSPLAGGASGAAVTASLTGLACGTTYHFSVNGANSGGVANGNDLTFTTPTCPAVTSISRASANPTAPGTSIAWTVVFNRSVTGVDATDFNLVTTGGISGAAITSVSGSGTSWTVSANTGSYGGTIGLNLVDDDSIIDSGGLPLGGGGAGNGDFTGEVYTDSVPFCSPPSNTPAGLSLTCVCDTFARSTLNPSPIFNANWIVSTSDTTGIVPSIVNSGYLRLTNNTGNNAKAATVPGIFPATGNYISVEFQQYAYNGSGADGIAVTLSDYAAAAVPGAFGGSLGYAQKTGAACNTTSCPGFAGGWIGVALDEFGNYQNPTEGRIGGPGVVAESVGIRGSGSGVNGYNWLGGTSGLSPLIDNKSSTAASPGYYYQVIVDARNAASGSTAVAVNRDTGGGYTSLVNIPNVFNAATAQGFTQAPVPSNWQISFTGSTGGSTNIHEISGLRICAQTVAPPSGGTASGFNAVDEAYGTPPSVAVQNYLTGHIYTKLVGTPFRLNVAAISDSQILTTYAAGSSKLVTLNLVDNSDGACVLDSTQANYCSSTCTSKPAIAGGSQTMTYASGATDKGQKQSANFTINTAYRNLVAIMSDGTTTACSTDAFAVRPIAISSVSSPNATNASTTGSPIFKAGSDNFTLTATTSGVGASPSGYSGVMKINSLKIQPTASAAGILLPATFPAAVSSAGSSTATGTTFTYSEVGGFQITGGYNPATDTTSARGVYDGVQTATECASPVTATQCDTLKAATWTGVDSISSKGDCIVDNYSNTKDASGKYGCNFGNVASSAIIGRFVPDHFVVTQVPDPLSPTNPLPYLTNRNELSCLASPSFSYMGEPIKLQFVLTAQNASNATTKNYTGALAALDLTQPSNFHLGAVDYYYGSTARNITQVTKANPGVVTTSAAHGYTNTDSVLIKGVNGMVQLNNKVWPVTVIDATHFSIGNTSTYSDYGSGGVALKKASPGTDLTARLTADSSSGSWANGVSSAISLVFHMPRLSPTPDGTYSAEVGIAPADADGVKLVNYDMDISLPAGNDHAFLDKTSLRHGRLLISNKYGSELFALPVELQAQYWDATLSWYVNNTDDSCTPLSAGNFLLTPSSGATITTTVSATGTLDGTGAGKIKLTKPSPAPTAKGSLQLKTNPSATPWPIDGYLPGSAIETFGIYNSGPVIYLREIFN
jgi:MSHA biogenesis protein MshQ